MRKLNNKDTKDVDADLKEMEHRLSVLRAEYNQFFVGARKQPPMFTEMIIKRIIKKYIADSTLKGHQRFKFHDLVARFNTMREYWNRRMRTREEGINIGAPSRFTPPERRRPGQEALRKLRQQKRVLKDPKAQEEDVRKLYLSFLRAVRDNQGDEGALSYPKFLDILDKQTSRIKQKRGCAAVEFRVQIHDDGQVKLKAKPVADKKTGDA